MEKSRDDIYGEKIKHILLDHFGIDGSLEQLPKPFMDLERIHIMLISYIPNAAARLRRFPTICFLGAVPHLRRRFLLSVMSCTSVL